MGVLKTSLARQTITLYNEFESKKDMYGGLERNKILLAIRCDRTRPGLNFDETKTASDMPSSSGRRLLIASDVAEEQVCRSFDVPGAFLRAPRNHNVMIVMGQPPRSTGKQQRPEMVCVLKQAMPGENVTNQL